jgi:hypothetical protein
MNRIRFAFVALVLASMMGLLGTQATHAQDSTPISVPTATSEGCDQVSGYVEERQQIANELLDGIAAVFPTVATPVIEHGDELLAAMMVMTPEQTKQLGDVYDATAEKIEKMENVPAIAQFYHDQIVALYRASAKTFHEAATTDLTTAGQKYAMELSAIATAIDSYGAAATAVCPEFADIIEIDQTQATL